MCYCRWCVWVYNEWLTRDNFVFDVAASQLVGWLISCFWIGNKRLSEILAPRLQADGVVYAHTEWNTHRMYSSRDCKAHAQAFTLANTPRHTAISSHTQKDPGTQHLSQEAAAPIWLIKHTHKDRALLDIVNCRGNNCISAVSKLNGCMLAGSAAGWSGGLCSAVGTLYGPCCTVSCSMSYTITCNHPPFHTHALACAQRPSWFLSS